MVQNFTTNSKLFLQFGTDKAYPELWGEYCSYGPNRIIEGILDLTGSAYPAGMSTTAATPTIISNTTFFPSLPAGELIIEKIDVFADVASASGTSWNLGLIKADRTTIPSGYGTGLIAAEVNATFATAGLAVTYWENTSKAGSLIASQPAVATAPYYLTAFTTGTFTTGQLRIRIHYHGLGPMTTASNITQ